MEKVRHAASPWLIREVPSDSLGSKGGLWLPALVSEPGPAIRGGLRTNDLEVLGREEMSHRDGCLVRAQQLLDSVPSLSVVVQKYVGKVFLLHAPEGFDISHSEPRWPTWIFVSVPLTNGSVSALRAAENVVHEAMHLRLTVLETKQALVADFTTKIASPWKGEPRFLQGLLHGIYVFSCIAAFFLALEPSELDEGGMRYIERRLEAIRGELAAIPTKTLREGLTASGIQFLAAVDLAVARTGLRVEA